MASLGSLVIELAANTARLQSDMGKAVSIAESAAKKINSAFSILGGLGAGAGLGEIALHAIELGDSLNKAAIKAGIGAKPISELAYAAKLADVDLSSLSTALKKMQVALSQAGSGAKEPQQALAALGLTIGDLKGLDADKQFELIADRISKLKDPADKTRAAVELFGRAGSDLLPLFEQGAAGIKKAREEAEKMGLSFSGEQLKKLGEADEAIKRLKASWEGFALSLTSKVAPALSGILARLSGVDTRTDNEKLATLRQQLISIEHGYNEDAKADLRSQIEDIEKSARLKRLSNAGHRGGDRGLGNSNEIAPGFKDPLQDSLEGISAVTVTARRLNAERLADLESDTKTSSQKEVQEYDKKLAEINQLRQEGYISEAEQQKRLAEIRDNFNRNELGEVVTTAKKIGETVNQLTVFAEQAARNMQDALANFLFDPFKDGLKGMLKGFIDVLRRMVAEAAAAKIFGTKASGGLGLGDSIIGGVGSVLGSLFGGGKAQGGPLQQGKWYTAGEHGPEAIWGGGAGAFAAGYGRGGNNMTIAPVYNIDARGATQELAKALPAILARNNADLIEGFQRGYYLR